MRDFAQDLMLAHHLADLADSISRDRYQSLDLVVETKPDLTPVTDADKAVERKIREALATARPDDLVLGEEFGAPTLTQDSYYWVIDPIDGTKNFLRGIPTWATLIALCNPQGEVVAGVVSAPALYRRWFAALGSGAYISENGGVPRQIKVSGVRNLKDASLSYSDLIGWGSRKAAMLKLQDEIWRSRGFGDFWSHMLVAEGALDIAVEPTLALWDMAALDIIVREAGGTFTNLDGTPGPHGGNGVSSNTLLHKDFLGALNS